MSFGVGGYTGVDFVAGSGGVVAFERSGFVSGNFDGDSAGGFCGVEDGFSWKETDAEFGLGFGCFGGVGVIELFTEDLVAAAYSYDGDVAVGSFDYCLVESSRFHPTQVGDGGF